jgi:glycerate-2-kinase
MQYFVPEERLKTLFYSALQSVEPYRIVKQATPTLRKTLEHEGYRRALIIGFGKAAYPMALAAIDEFVGLQVETCIITKYGHAEKNTRLKVYEASHPIPDENGVQATERLVNLLKRLDKDTFILCLISGGGSSLLVSPCDGVSLKDKQETVRALLNVGATIQELNAVRKHISNVKGGRLAERLYPARVVSLIMSDVIGDSLDVIASGPTSPDASSFPDAMRAIEKYRLKDKLPASVVARIAQGVKQQLPETPKPSSTIFQRVENRIIASNRIALDAAFHQARQLGLNPEIVASRLQGEARDAAQWLARQALAKKGKSLCLISGGETTVTVRGNGVGGRNTELALAFALAIQGCKGVALLSAGTDGSDGPTDATGAIVDGYTIKNARLKGFDGERFLQNNDSYTFFKQVGGLLITGPTRTNVMDIQLTLINANEQRY